MLPPPPPTTVSIPDGQTRFSLPRDCADKAWGVFGVGCQLQVLIFLCLALRSNPFSYALILNGRMQQTNPPHAVAMVQIGPFPLVFHLGAIERPFFFILYHPGLIQVNIDSIDWNLFPCAFLILFPPPDLRCLHLCTKNFSWFLLPNVTLPFFFG